MRLTLIRMRRIRLTHLLFTIALAASPALSQTPSASAPDAPAQARGNGQLQPLYDALKRERDPEKAGSIANEIMSELNDSGSATVNLLMQWASTAVGEKRNGAALDFLDQATLLRPDFAEGWNRRAGLHYAMGDTRKSMADINQVLQREPRHFGAIAGMAAILTDVGQDELALKAWQRYLSIYPADRDAQEAAIKLSEKIAGSRT
tara:strand:+ start:131 stop:745 length:615 start_codon:yes stop_codon:yes gene_type:complete